MVRGERNGHQAVGWAGEAGVKLRLAGLAIGASIALANSAWAATEVLVKCDGVLPQGQRYTVDNGWQPFPNPDRSVTITRTDGKLSVQLDGDRTYTSRLVFALPQSNIKTFKVLGQNGIERFQLVEGLGSGKPEMRHTISGGSDGSHHFNIRVTTLDNCSVISPDVAVEKQPPAPGGSGGQPAGVR